MSDKRLRELGADCICGDLILDRVTVGHYRNGQFVITPEGAEVLEKDKAEPAAKKPATAKAETKPPKAERTKAAKDKPEAPPAAESTSADAPITDPVDDLTSGLDDMLNA